MNTLERNRSNWIILSITVFIVLCAGYYYRNIEQTSLVLASICGGILLLGLLFFHFSWFYLLLVAVIPISVDLDILIGSRLNFPSEGLLLLALPVLMLFNQSYRKATFRVLKHPISLLLVADLLIELVTSLTSTHIDVSLKRILIRFLFIAGFYLIYQLISDQKKLIYPWLFYAIGLIPVMVFTLMNHYSHFFDPRVVFNICAPYFNDHTVYGACLAFIIPILVVVLIKRKLFSLNKRKTILLFSVFLVILLSEILALSRAAIISLVVAILFALLLYYKIKFSVIIVGLGLLSIVFWVVKDDVYESVQQNEAVSNDGEISNHFSSVTNIKSDASNLERINRWVCAWRMFEERPLIGYGPGTYQFEYNQFQTLVNKTYISTNTGDRGNAHSEYLTYLSETGIIGFVIFLLTVFTAVFYGMQNHYELSDPLLKAINLGVLLGLITFFFHGLVNSFIDQSKMAFLYYTALGTIVLINQKLKNKSIHHVEETIAEND